jgi:ferritin
MKKNKILSDKVESKINELIGEELKAMYAYSAIANWCQENGYLKAFTFFLGESDDEKKHSEVWQKYVLDLGCVPELTYIDTPESDFDSLSAVIEFALDMETSLGEMYSDFASDIMSKDAMTFTKTQEFIAIQIESIGFYGDICAAGEGLSTDKFQQLMLEKILIG